MDSKIIFLEQWIVAARFEKPGRGIVSHAPILSREAA
jgi:hypothetical protein